MSKGATGETKFRVRYAETDQMGVVYHSNFAIWFEIGRVELLRQLGFRYRDMEQQDNCRLPVVDLRVRYKLPAMYDEEILVRTSIANVRKSLLHFRYEVRRADDGALLAEGETTHLIVDEKLQRRRLPEKYLAAFMSTPIDSSRE
ncbi:MAG TPA: thioesterase family protein [Candidatus Angelobacter sp.]|nr:thioesterase family protein [Candidatus Angelobacter sp.]